MKQDKTLETLVNTIMLKLEQSQLACFGHSMKERYLTRRQLSELLSVDLTTLHRWSKTGKLPSYRLGGRIYYKMLDVESKMLQVPNLKDGRA